MSNATIPAASNPALKPLPFDPAKLKGLSERLMRSHWENNYGGSVKALAATKKQLAEALGTPDLPPYLYNELKREHLLRTGSVVLHEHYFDNLGGSGQADAGSRKTLAEAFGSFDSWETEFRRIGLGLGGGSGWVVLGFNTHTRQLENYWMADHAHGPAATLPMPASTWMRSSRTSSGKQWRSDWRRAADLPPPSQVERSPVQADAGSLGNQPRG